MSLVNSILAAGERNLLACGHGDIITLLTQRPGGTVAPFVARIDLEPTLDPDAPLGADPRMAAVLRIANPAPDIRPNDVIQANGVRYRVRVPKDDNAVSITTDFYLEQMGPDDT